jgi:hypothetical protein
VVIILFTSCHSKLKQAGEASCKVQGEAVLLRGVGFAVVHAAFMTDTLRELPRIGRFVSFLDGRAMSTAFRRAAASAFRFTLRVKNSSPEAKLLDRRGRVCKDGWSELDATVDEVLLNPSKDGLGAGKDSVAVEVKTLKSPDAKMRKMVSS